MAVILIIMEADDNQIADIEAEAVPRVGEYLWLTDGLGAEQVQSHWRVTEVAYWLFRETRIPAYRVAVYVESVPVTKTLG